MGYRCALILVLFLALGCTEADKVQWNDALKDLNGDNMNMQYGGSTKGDGGDRMDTRKLME